MCLKKIARNKRITKKLEFVSIGAKANMFSLVNVDKMGRYKILMRGKENNPIKRKRPDQNQKGAPLIIKDMSAKSDFSQLYGEYGMQWSIQIKGNKWI